MLNHNIISKLTQKYYLSRQGFEVTSELEKTSAKPGLGIGKPIPKLLNQKFTLNKYKEVWEAQKENEQYFGFLNMLDLALRELQSGTKLDSNLFQFLEAFISKGTTNILPRASPDWKKIIKYHIQIAEFCVSENQKLLGKTSPDEEVKKTIMSEAKAIHDSFYLHLLKLRAALHDVAEDAPVEEE